METYTYYLARNPSDIIVSEYDDERAIIVKIILDLYHKTRDGKFPPLDKVLPFVEFFVLDVSSLDKTIKVSYAPWDIQNMEESDILNVHKMSSLSKRFPDINAIELFVLWVYVKYKSFYNSSSIKPEYVRALKIYAGSIFYDDKRVNAELESFMRNIDDNLAKLNTYNDEVQKLFLKLKIGPKVGQPRVGSEGFIQEGIVVGYYVGSEGVSLFELFDSIKTSDRLPLLMVKYMGKYFYKVHSTFQIPENWIQDPSEYAAQPLADGIHFRVSGIPAERLNSKHIKLDNKYAMGYWTSDGTIQFKIRKMEEGFYSDEVLKVVMTHLDDTHPKKWVSDAVKSIIKTSENAKGDVFMVKGHFKVFDAQFSTLTDRIVLSHLVMMDDVMSKFLFIDEGVGSAVTKDRYYIYYEILHHYIPETALTLTLTPMNGYLKVRIRRANNILQAEACSRVFGKLLAYYKTKYNNAKSAYSLYISEDLDVQKGKKKDTENKKTKSTLKKLQTEDPGMFGKGGDYSVQCTSQKQPTIVTEEELETLKNMDYYNFNSYEKDGYKSFFDRPGAVMDFNGKKYVCLRDEFCEKCKELKDSGKPVKEKCKKCNDIRRNSGKNINYIWPGLKVNSSDRVEYSSAYPELPCCFLRPNTPDQEKEEVQKKAYILQYHKALKPGQRGSLPIALSKIIDTLGVEKIVVNKAEVLPYYRYKPSSDKDSVMWCLELATNKSSVGKTTFSRVDNYAKRRMLVDAAKAKISTMEIGRGYQEAVGVTEQQLRKTLVSDEYVDEGLYHSLLEKYYNVKIYVFDVMPDASVVPSKPRHSIVHLGCPTESDGGVVVLFKQKSLEGSHPFDYEIMTFWRGASEIYDMSAIRNIIEDIFIFCEKTFIVHANGTYSTV